MAACSPSPAEVRFASIFLFFLSFISVVNYMVLPFRRHHHHLYVYTINNCGSRLFSSVDAKEHAHKKTDALTKHTTTHAHNTHTYVQYTKTVAERNRTRVMSCRVYLFNHPSPSCHFVSCFLQGRVNRRTK